MKPIRQIGVKRDVGVSYHPARNELGSLRVPDVFPKIPFNFLLPEVSSVDVWEG